MQRKRDGLVPIGEVLDLTDEPVNMLRETPQLRRRGFTLTDQVDNLVGARETDPNVGFMARLLALCSLPRTNPGDRHQYKRVNGPYKLIMIAGGDNKLPFGNLPRLLLAWVATESVQTQSRVLTLGRSLSAFMRTLGVYDSSGLTQTRLRNQMRRLFGCSVQLTYQDEQVERFVHSPIAESGEYWWNPHQPDQSSLWESKIELSGKFFQEIILHPVPLDMNTLKALKRSTLGLDLYMWLAYRTFALRAPLRLTWRQVYRQFGVAPEKASDKVTVQAFRRKVLRELGKIKTAWPGLNYSLAKGVLVLAPSNPTIAPTRLRIVK